MARSIKRAASWAAPQFLALFRQLDRLRRRCQPADRSVRDAESPGDVGQCLARVTACKNAFFSGVRPGFIPMIVRLRISCRQFCISCCNVFVGIDHSSETLRSTFKRAARPHCFARTQSHRSCPTTIASSCDVRASVAHYYRPRGSCCVRRAQVAIRSNQNGTNLIR